MTTIIYRIVLCVLLAWGGITSALWHTDHHRQLRQQADQTARMSHDLRLLRHQVQCHAHELSHARTRLLRIERPDRPNTVNPGRIGSAETPRGSIDTDTTDATPAEAADQP